VPYQTFKEVRLIGPKNKSIYDVLYIMSKP